MTKIALSDGQAIHARISGVGKAIVFVHGWAMDGKAFEHQVRAFADTHTVVALDLRGHGKSRIDGPPPTIDRLGLDLVDLFNELDLRDVICVGWSLGAMVVWQAFSQPGFAERVKGLAIVDMSPLIANDSNWQLGLRSGKGATEIIGQAATMRQSWPKVVQQFVPRIFAPGAETQHAAMIRRIRREALTLNPDQMAGLWESLAQQDFRWLVAKLKKPTLIMHGLQSQLYSCATSEFLANAAPQATTVAFENSGHAPHLEEPDEFNRQLMSFVLRLDDDPVKRGDR